MGKVPVLATFRLGAGTGQMSDDMSTSKEVLCRPHEETAQAESCAHDPLGDVIDWLGRADLSAEITGEDSSSGSCSVGGKALVEGTLPSPGPASSSGAPADPPGFTGRQRKNGSQQRLTAYCGLGQDIKEQSLTIESEEEEWEARQQQTGAAGRLVIYDVHDHPSQDFLLRGGSGRRIMVAAVTDGGKAAQAGVKAGDVLVSIDGKKDFKDKSADNVHASLKGPVLLVFMGFVGKLQAEVRLNYRQKVCGLSSQHQVVFGRPDAPVQVVDEIIFQPGLAALLLTTTPPELRQSASQGKVASGVAGDDGNVGEELDGSDEEQGGGSKPSTGCLKSQTETTVESLAAVYELRGPEARSLVNRALSRARKSSPFAPRYVHPQNVMGDHAQAPRSTAPVSSPLTSRLVDKLGNHAGYIGTKPFHFATDGSQMGGQKAGNMLVAQDSNKAYCDVDDWWSGTSCPRPKKH